MRGGLKIGQLALQPWVDIFRGAEKLTLIWFLAPATLQAEHCLLAF